jgi:predicted transposase YbfD/YdcC
MAAAAVLTGARSITTIAEWAADTPQPVRAALGARRDGPDRWVVPAETTIRRTLARVDPELLAAVIGAWLADRGRPGQRRRAVAVDAKTLRGARCDGRQVQLLAAMDYTTRAVLAPCRVDGAAGAVPGFQPLLGDLELAGVVVTADALPSHREAAEFLVAGKPAHYLFTVKANQPTLLDRCQRLPWQHVPVLDRTRDRAHGRVELRTLKAVSVAGFGFPHAAQVIQVTRKTRDLRTRRWRTATVHAITSLTFAQASPARLADLIGGHWAIENGLHWVRDVTFAEDASQVRTGSAPQVMACLRNLVIGALSRAGPVNLAAALRHHARDHADHSPSSASPSDETDNTQERRSPEMTMIHPDEDSLVSHLELARERIAKAYEFLATTRIDFCGTPSDALVEQFRQMGTGRRRSGSTSPPVSAATPRSESDHPRGSQPLLPERIRPAERPAT